MNALSEAVITQVFKKDAQLRALTYEEHVAFGMFHIAEIALFACNPLSRSFLTKETSTHKQESWPLILVNLLYQQVMLGIGSVGTFLLVPTRTWSQRVQRRWQIHRKKKVVSKGHRYLIKVPRSQAVKARELTISYLNASCQAVRNPFNFLRSNPALTIPKKKKKR